MKQMWSILLVIIIILCVDKSSKVVSIFDKIIAFKEGEKKGISYLRDFNSAKFRNPAVLLSKTSKLCDIS